MNCGPIFIAGCGRSGTTYVRTAIDAHPDVFIPEESLFIPQYLRYARCVPKRLVEWLFFNEPQLRLWYSGPLFDIGNIQEAICRVHEHAAGVKGAKIWGQKTPRFVRDMDLFNSSIEGVRWILVFRDPRATVASMLRSRRHTYSVSRACRRWIRDNRPIVEILESGRSPENVFIVKYEDFVRDFDILVETIFAYLGVESIDREEIVRQGSGPSFRGTRFEDNALRQGMEPRVERIEAWRTTLTKEQVRYIESACWYEMGILGYRATSDIEEMGHTRLRSRNEWIPKTQDILILFEYLYRWPRYLLHTALRQILFAVCHSARSAHRIE